MQLGRHVPADGSARLVGENVADWHAPPPISGGVRPKIVRLG